MNLQQKTGVNILSRYLLIVVYIIPIPRFLPRPRFYTVSHLDFSHKNSWNNVHIGEMSVSKGVITLCNVRGSTILIQLLMQPVFFQKSTTTVCPELYFQYLIIQSCGFLAEFPSRLEIVQFSFCALQVERIHSLIKRNRKQFPT